MSLTIGVPREIVAGEKRVATVPEVVEKLIKLGFKVAVESGAGDAANCSDDSYRAVGASIVEAAPQARRSSKALPTSGPLPTLSSRSPCRPARRSACCARAAP